MVLIVSGTGFLDFYNIAMCTEDSKPDSITSSKALKYYLEEKGFRVIAVGVARSGLIVYVQSRIKEVRQHIDDKCLGQWQTYSVDVRRMSMPTANSLRP